jgi:excinuclease UvrABC nuclease subunit
MDKQIETWRKSMKEAAISLDFEKAAHYRDRIRNLEQMRLDFTGEEHDY